MHLPDAKRDTVQVLGLLRALWITTLLVALVVAGIWPGSVPPARANVLPEVLLRFHVQDTPDSSFCLTNPITSCAQIRRTSYATGSVEFDLYLDAYEDGLILHSASIALTWPAAWSVTGFEPCGGAQGTLQAGSTGGQLELAFPGDPPMPETLLLIARVVVEVTGEGAFEESATAYSVVRVGPGPNYTSLDLYGIDAHAGVVCNDCSATCGYADYCHARFLNFLTLFEGPGGVATGYFDVYLNESAGPGSCMEEWFSDQPWIEVTGAEAYHPAPWNWRVWVRATSVGMPAGVYEGHVLGHSPVFHCTGCGLVRLTIGETSDIEEPVGPRVQSVSWGEVKRHFR